MFSQFRNPFRCISSYNTIISDLQSLSSFLYMKQVAFMGKLSSSILMVHREGPELAFLTQYSLKGSNQITAFPLNIICTSINFFCKITAIVYDTKIQKFFIILFPPPTPYCILHIWNQQKSYSISMGNKNHSKSTYSTDMLFQKNTASNGLFFPPSKVHITSEEQQNYSSPTGSRETHIHRQKGTTTLDYWAFLQNRITQGPSAITSVSSSTMANAQEQLCRRGKKSLVWLFIFFLLLSRYCDCILPS